MLAVRLARDYTEHLSSRSEDYDARNNGDLGV